MVGQAAPTVVGTRRGVVAFVAAVLVGVVAGAGTAAWWMARPGRPVVPERLRTETTAVNKDGTAIGVKQYHGFDVSAAEGRECLVPLSRGQPIELGLVRAAPTADRVGGELVVWIQCLGPPRDVYGRAK